MTNDLNCLNFKNSQGWESKPVLFHSSRFCFDLQYKIIQGKFDVWMGVQITLSVCECYMLPDSSEVFAWQKLWSLNNKGTSGHTRDCAVAAGILPQWASVSLSRNTVSQCQVFQGSNEKKGLDDVSINWK